jgi:hypothetical protein
MLAEKYDVVILGGGNPWMGVTVPTCAVVLPPQSSRPGFSTAPARTAPPRRCSLRQDARCTRSNGERS